MITYEVVAENSPMKDDVNWSDYFDTAGEYMTYGETEEEAEV